MGNILIRNCDIVDTVTEKVNKGSVLICGDTIKGVFENTVSDDELSAALNTRAFKLSDFDGHIDSNKVIDAAGLTLVPGLIDMHVHFRDPGLTEKEDLEHGEAAAAHGGFTTVCAMPNTKPPIDDADKFLDVTKRADAIGLTKVLQVGAMTAGMQGEKLSDMEGMAKAGLKAFSEDGKSVMDTTLFYSAMEKAASLNIPVLSHCEDKALVRGGVMNYGAKSKEFKLPGITNSVENIIAYRDIDIARETGTRLHLCHCSTKESAELLIIAKDMGLPVTGEVCPHHFILCDDDIPSADDANYKMNPPLRSKTDRTALLEAIKEGIFDVISTDHAPHTAEEKSKGFSGSPFGIVGLETSFALSYTYLVKSGLITLPKLIQKMSFNPAKILGLDRGEIREGKIADLTLIDLNKTYKINPDDFKSKGRNTPFGEYEVSGEIEYTIYGGKISYEMLQ